MEPALSLLHREFGHPDEGVDLNNNSNTDIDYNMKGPSDSANQDGNGIPTYERRPGRNIKFLEFMRMSKFNFTDNIMLILEVANYEGLEKWEYVPVRNLLDTGSAKNFISRRILIDNQMDMSKVVSIPIKDRAPQTLKLLDNRKFVPEEEITLLWHRLNDRKQRKDTFIILDDAMFYTLIGGKQFMNEDNVALPVVKDEGPLDLLKRT